MITRGPEGGDRLAALVTATPDTTPDPHELRRRYRDFLPGYMIPEHVEVVAVLEYTSTGKVDCRPLTAPVRAVRCAVHTLVHKRQLAAHTLETWEWASLALGRVKRAIVLVPRTCTAEGRDVSALYLLHGFGGSRTTWLTGTRLTEHLAGLELLVVLPESGRRWRRPGRRDDSLGLRLRPVHGHDPAEQEPGP